MQRCRLCKTKEEVHLIDFGKHPIAHHFLSSQLQKEYNHSVVLCFCEHCGFIQLDSPIPPALLYTEYVCLSSWKYQPHIPRLIQIIEEMTGSNESSKILEVGSNDGRFLRELSDCGYRSVVGIEPARDAQEAAKRGNITTIPSYFNRDAAEIYLKSYGKCDIFISRQMLEHISDLQAFQEAMAAVLSPGSYVVFEVPNFMCNLDNSDYTIWEEHSNYFTLETLNRFLNNIGIQIIHSESIVFSGETLIVIGQYLGNAITSSFEYIDSLTKKVIKYRDCWPEFRNTFIEYLNNYKKNGQKVVAYGAGSRLCSLVNFIGLGPYLEFIVDDQPEKQGKFMPGSRLPILPSDALKDHGIDVCLLAVNAECEDRVVAKHMEFEQGGGSFVSVLPPSKRLPKFWNDMKCLSKV